MPEMVVVQDQSEVGDARHSLYVAPVLVAFHFAHPQRAQSDVPLVVMEMNQSHDALVVAAVLAVVLVLKDAAT
ncbi:MAG: hypothetical protein NVS9B9_02600 [Ktedonobacteraceae bacterium]